MKLTNNERLHIISDEITTPNYRGWRGAVPAKARRK